ncbi:unnamed protein product [Brachionus calyciflorus]|uniref:Uncharacterized protein n=1 Tax=Brachionus calyciflorus TaxID=104777 RepID=A0A814LT54_9BILA|nr:unnamed protein product [Brachionus calyciflorus]
MCAKCNKTKVWKARNVVSQYTWRCTTCGTYISYRNNSFLDLFDLPVNKLFNIIYHWSMQYEYTWRHNKNLTRYGAFEAILYSIATTYPAGANVKEEKASIEELMGELDAMKINEEEYDFDFINEKDKVPLEDGDINDLDSPVVDPVVEPVFERVVVHDVVPLSKLDIQSFTETIYLIISQMLQGLYLEYRFFSDLNKAQRKVIYEKCDSQNICYAKSGTRFVIITISINKCNKEREPISNLSK